MVCCCAELVCQVLIQDPNNLIDGGRLDYEILARPWSDREVVLMVMVASKQKVGEMLSLLPTGKGDKPCRHENVLEIFSK